MAQAMEKLDPERARRVVPLFITIDPERDTPKVLVDYCWGLYRDGERIGKEQGVNQLQQWAPVAIIVAGYLLGFYFQNRRVDDLITRFDKRIDDLKEILRAEMARNHSEMMAKFAGIEHRLERIQ